MKRIHRLHRFYDFLLASEGSALPIVGFAVLALMGTTGSAIDMGRAQMVQAKLSNSLDAAGLAAGASVSTANATTEARKYFNANFPSGYMGSTVRSFTVNVSSDSHIINLDAQARMPTSFMHLFGQDYVDVSAHSEITRAAKGMELALVLDVTGSMSGSKLTALKSASTNLINILYGSNETQENLWVGLVPFSQAVNIGASRTAWVTTDSFNWGPTSWAGCVDAREASNRDVTDDPPSVAKFPRYYWPCHTSNNAWYGTNSSRNNCSTSGTIRYKTLTSSLGPNKYCPTAVTAMTASKTTVLNAIAALTAQGNTHVGLGAVWGWRMLSPRWRGLWGGEMNANQLPLDYNTPLMNKVMILMTDGDNTIDNSSRGAYWYLSDGKLGTTNQSTAESRLDSRLAQVCASAKAQGIIVYTIGFDDPGATISNLLRTCASNTDYYFNSPTSADLQTAFQMIGDSLANLRISK